MILTNVHEQPIPIILPSQSRGHQKTPREVDTSSLSSRLTESARDQICSYCGRRLGRVRKLEKQGRLITLLDQLATPASSASSVICKVLLLSRDSSFLRKRLRKKTTTVSLSDSAEVWHLETAIRSYAVHKFSSLQHRLSQTGIGHQDIKDMASKIAAEADGKHEPTA